MAGPGDAIAADFWLSLPQMPPAWYRLLITVAPRRFRGWLISLWLWWQAPGCRRG